GMASAADAAVSGMGQVSQRSLAPEDAAPSGAVSSSQESGLPARDCSLLLSDEECLQAYRDFPGMPVENRFLPADASSTSIYGDHQVMRKRERHWGSGSAGFVLSGLFALAGVGAVRSAR